jgi:hypothetical protein
VELVTQSRERPPFDTGCVRQRCRGVGRDQAVVLAVEDQRGDPEPTGRLAAYAGLLGERLDHEPRGADLHAERVIDGPLRHRRIAGQGVTADPGGDFDRRGHSGDADGEAFLPARQGRIERRRGQDRQIGLRPIAQQIAGRDEASERMGVDDERSARRAGPGRRQPRREVVVEQ